MEQTVGPCVIRTRVWRNGSLEAEDFPFEQVSDYLADPDCLVWADLLRPTATTPRAAGRGAEPRPARRRGRDSARDERPKATRYSTHLFLTAYSIRLRHRARTSSGRSRVGVQRAPRGRHRPARRGRSTSTRSSSAGTPTPSCSSAGRAGCCTRSLDEIVDGYLDVIDDLSTARSSEVEDMLFDEAAQASNDVSKRTFVLRRVAGGGPPGHAADARGRQHGHAPRGRRRRARRS